MEKILAVALDVDGVLTDGSFIWGTSGEEFKKFCFLDVMGISLGKKAGLIFALISGEDTPLIDRYAEKMGIICVYKGCKDKAGALRHFAQLNSLELKQISFMGDDINDVPALMLAGLPAVPITAHESARNISKFQAKAGGGLGAVRELVDYILICNGEFH